MIDRKDYGDFGDLPPTNRLDYYREYLYVLLVLTQLPYLLMDFKGTRKISELASSRPLDEISKKKKKKRSSISRAVSGRQEHSRTCWEMLECNQQGAGFLSTFCYAESNKHAHAQVWQNVRTGSGGGGGERGSNG